MKRFLTLCFFVDLKNLQKTKSTGVKKIVAKKLLDAVKTVGIKETKLIGKYRGFPIEVGYNFMTNQHIFIPESLKRFEEKLQGTKEQLEIAKVEVEKPFDKADELKDKTLRLTEIN